MVEKGVETMNTKYTYFSPPNGVWYSAVSIFLLICKQLSNRGPVYGLLVLEAI